MTRLTWLPKTWSQTPPRYSSANKVPLSLLLSHTCSDVTADMVNAFFRKGPWSPTPGLCAGHDGCSIWPRWPSSSSPAPVLGGSAHLSLRVPPVCGGSVPCYNMLPSPGPSHSCLFTARHRCTWSSRWRAALSMGLSVRPSRVGVCWPGDPGGLPLLRPRGNLLVPVLPTQLLLLHPLPVLPRFLLLPSGLWVKCTVGMHGVTERVSPSVRRLCALSSFSTAFPSTPNVGHLDSFLCREPLASGAGPPVWLLPSMHLRMLSVHTITLWNLEFSRTRWKKGREGSGWWDCGVSLLPCPHAFKPEDTCCARTSHSQRTPLFTSRVCKPQPVDAIEPQSVSFTPMTKWSSFGDVQFHRTGQAHGGINCTSAINQTRLEGEPHNVYL